MSHIRLRTMQTIKCRVINKNGFTVGFTHYFTALLQSVRVEKTKIFKMVSRPDLLTETSAMNVVILDNYKCIFSQVPRSTHLILYSFHIEPLTGMCF